MRVAIHSPADTQVEAIQWRDARVKHELAEAVRAAGHDLCYDDEDVNIWIHGVFTKNFLPRRNHVAWIISHPRVWLNIIDTQPPLRRMFRHVFCASQRLVEATKLRGLEASYLPCPAPRRSPANNVGPFQYDLALIGNAAANKGRDKLRPLFEKYRSYVVGSGWDDIGAANVIQWKDIPAAINQAKLYIHTAYPDMRAWGIMPDNVLDAAANSRALVLHDSGSAAAEMKISSPDFHNAAELEGRIVSLLSDEPKRVLWESLQRETAQKYVGYEVAVEALCRA